jgi:hypothetical protein
MAQGVPEEGVCSTNPAWRVSMPRSLPEQRRVSSPDPTNFFDKTCKLLEFQI